MFIRLFDAHRFGRIEQVIGDVYGYSARASAKLCRQVFAVLLTVVGKDAASTTFVIRESPLTTIHFRVFVVREGVLCNSSYSTA
jgi:hypothetical protein